jgi:hypothetical protein
VAQSVLRDAYHCRLPSLSKRSRRQSIGKAGVASEWQNLITTGAVKTRAELARIKGISRARVTQVLGKVTSNADEQTSSKRKPSGVQ